MKNILKIVTLILGFCLLLVGCGNGIPQEEYDKVVAERDKYKEKVESQKEEKTPYESENVVDNASQKKIIKDKTYNIDDEDNIRFVLYEDSINVFITIADVEKASIVFMDLLGMLYEVDDIDKSVTVTCDEGMAAWINTDGTDLTIGTNKNGESVMTMPDWIIADVDELTISEEERDDLFWKIIEFLNDFIENE